MVNLPAGMLKPLEGSIPEQIKDGRFIILGGEDGKKPIAEAWQNKMNYPADHPMIKEALRYERNIGFVTGKNGYLVIDFDDAELQERLLPLLPQTFAVKTGGKGLLHLYFKEREET